MPYITSCSGGRVSYTTCDVRPTYQVVQQEVRPYKVEQSPNWLEAIGDVLGAVWEWLKNQIGQALANEENLSYASVVLGTRQTWIGPYPITVVEQEQLDYSGDVTRFPIEDRNELADHIHNYPKKIMLKAWLGSPISGIAAIGAQFGGGNILDTSPFWQAKTLMIQLAKLQRDRIPVFYVSGLQIIPNVVITRFRPLLKAPYGNAMLAEIVLEQVMFGKSPDIKEGEDLAEVSTPGDGGTQEPIEDSGEQGESWLMWLLRLLGVLK